MFWVAGLSQVVLKAATVGAGLRQRGAFTEVGFGYKSIRLEWITRSLSWKLSLLVDLGLGPGI